MFIVKKDFKNVTLQILDFISVQVDLKYNSNMV